MIEDGILNDYSSLIRAKNFESEAKKSTNLHKQLLFWDKAEKYYSSIKIDDVNNSNNKIEVINGHLNSLFNLNKYYEFNKIFNKNRKICELDVDCLLMKATIKRRGQELDSAQIYCDKVLKLQPTNKLALKEKQILKQLKNESKLETKLEAYATNPIDLFEKLKNKEVNEAKSKYKILSIDGGGIRGILPAFWLSELEFRTRKPISKLFNLISGTSTGGLIASGLVIPNKHNKDIPAFRALDILNIYRKESSYLFTTNKSILKQKWNQIANSVKYTDEGRTSIIGKYFGTNDYYNDALIDIIIPAVKETDLMRTHVFKKDIKYDKLRFYDVVMSTSSAPTFFSPYKIDGIHKDLDGYYIDGGLHANNPAQLAYNYCLNNNLTKRDNIFMLSLGTGNYIDNSLSDNLDESRSLLFWAKNIYPILSGNNEFSVNDNMSINLGVKNYNRWQLNLTKPIALDDYTEASLNYLLDMGNQYLIEMYESDDNCLNKLIEFLA